MGNDVKISRRALFNLKTAKINNEANQGVPPPDDDPLFKKYSRKSLGARRYSTQMEEYNPDRQLFERVGNVTTGLTPYSGSWTIWEAAHLLKRAGFGSRKADIDTLLGMTPSAAVDSLFTFSGPSNPSTTPVNYYESIIPDTGGIPLGSSWTSNNLTYVSGNDGTLDAYRANSLAYWTWGLFINEGLSIREKMMLFWYHFIPMDIEEIRNQVPNGATLCHDYFALLRSNTTGNFKTLIKAIAKSPAMLVYMSLQYSTAAAPNENFARELLELFTMGKVPTQNYTEDDIRAAAKVFSGWRVPAFYSTAGSNYPFSPGFNASYHNQTNKTFSAFFGNTTINNQAGAAGANEFDIFFDMLFTQQQTQIATYLAMRLYRFFIYYDIDANVQANVITPLANLIISNNWNMEPVVKALFKSEHFFDMANRGVVIKSPVDHLAGMLRTFNVNTTPAAGANQVLNQYSIWAYFHNYSTWYLEQSIGYPPNVSGWKAYYQAPSYYQNWINANTVQRRSGIVTNLLNGFTSGGTPIKLDLIAFVQQFPNATIQDPDLLINAIIPLLLPKDLPTDYKSNTKIQTLLSGQITNGYWTTAWNNYTASPTNTTYLNTVNTRLKSLFTALLQLAEHYLM